MAKTKKTIIASTEPINIEKTYGKKKAKKLQKTISAITIGKTNTD